MVVPAGTPDLHPASVAAMTLHRRQPFAGMPVTVVSLAARRRGAIAEVADEGRRLVVITDDGAALTFALSRATGRFMEDGAQTGARLHFDDDSHAE